MPVYNTREEYLREAIESILNQSYKNFELIIFNDGSTNNAKQVILSYKDPRIRYYEHKNQGIAKTTNKMLELAKGEYIALADSDDVSIESRLEREAKFLDNNADVDVVSACYKEIPSVWKYRIPDNPTEIKYADLIRRNQVPNVCAMFRSKLTRVYNLRYDESFPIAQDYEFWSRAIRYCKIFVLPDVLCLYRIRSDSNSRFDSQQTIKYSRIIQQNMLNWLTNDVKLQRGLVNYFHKKSFSNALLYLIKKILS